MRVRISLDRPFGMRFSEGEDVLRTWPRDGHRVEADALAAREAPTLMLGDPAAMAEVEGGWLFLMQDGGGFRASSFLGEPVPLGRLVEPPFTVGSGWGWSRGRLPLVREAAPGSLWTSTGGTFEPMPAAGDRVVAAAFVDRERGLVVTADGGVLWTGDGGSSFRALDVPHAVEHVRVWGGGYVVSGSGESRSCFVDRDGAVHASDVADSQTTAARRVRYAELPPRDTVDRASAAVFRPGLFRRVGEDAPPELRSCSSLAAWGSGRLAICGSDPPRLRHAPREGVPLADVPGVALTSGSVGRILLWVLDDDGVHVGISGSCASLRSAPRQKRADEEEELRVDPVPTEPMCIVDVRDGAMRELTTGQWERVAALHGGRALVVGPGWPVPVRAYDEVGAPLALGPEAEIASVEVHDGRVVLVDREGVAWLGRVGALERRPLPRGAFTLSLADDARGLAVGTTLAHVYVTRDGARTFERVPIDAPAHEMRWPGLTTVTCHREWCFAQLPRQHALLVTRGFGPPASVPRAVANQLRVVHPD